MIQHSLQKRQQGTVLVLSMVILLILTVIGVGGMQNSNLEQRMAGNMRDYQLAFQAADSIIEDAEWELINEIAVPLEGDTPGTQFWVTRGPDPDSGVDNGLPWWRENNSAWWAINGRTPASRDFGNVESPPVYVIESLGKVRSGFALDMNDPPMTVEYRHRIVSRGVGARDDTAVGIEVIYRKEYQ